MSAKGPGTSEALTRTTRIDPQLTAQGWQVVGHDAAAAAAGAYTRHAVRELPTASGPADYALFVDGKVVGIVEAKKTAVDPQNVLVQAERYARGVEGSPFLFHGYRVPFLYATNGEEIWFRDVRSTAELSRRVADFHTPRALAERLAHDLDAACARLAATPNTHPRIRPYWTFRRVAVATARADKIRQAILTKAFRGELVPTEAELARAEGSPYEPASALLARIRGEREKAPEATTRTRKHKGASA